MNKVILTGNLTRDVEVRYTQSNKAYARAGIAVNRPFSQNKEVDFINLLAWNKTAEFMEKYFSKGSKILVEGRLATSKYKDKDGNERTSTEVIVDNIEFAGGRKDSNEFKPDNQPDNRSDNRRNDNRKPQFSDDDFYGEPVNESDVPF